MQQNAVDTVGESTSPWSFQQLCRAAFQQTSLSKLVGDDLTLLAEHMVRTKLAVREEGVLKVVARGGGAASEAGRETRTAGVISETDKDLLRIRCTGTNYCSL